MKRFCVRSFVWAKRWSNVRKAASKKFCRVQLRGSLSGLEREGTAGNRHCLRTGLGDRTGRTATAEQAQEAHAFIRKTLQRVSDETTADKIRIQYGGSVKPDNAASLVSQPDIDGALVGGASLVRAVSP